MQANEAYRIERTEGLMTIDSEAIPGQIYIIDDERRGMAIGLGDVVTRSYRDNLLIGLTHKQMVDMANEMLDIAEIFLEDGKP